MATMDHANVLVGMDLYNLSVALTLILLPVATFSYIRNDYHAFLSLGPGGTPATPFGYMKIKLLSLVCLRDPLRPIPIPPHFRPQKGYLSSLPARAGKRPLIKGIAPQRQRTEKSSIDVYKGLVAGMRRLIDDPANSLLERTSCFEKNSSGIFSSEPITRTCGGEVCHAHPSDGSMHMTLHPADIKIILEKGWGERHPLARGGWCRRFVPREFMLVYAPRNQEEIELVMEIISAAVWWVSGVDVKKDGAEKRILKTYVGDYVASQNDCKACGSKAVEKMTGDT